ncbi:substrate-binding domain-containing protein [Lichenihabitans psoromatis]|uniref:substrate-binding domain-containing protein n=1 Tax=Lichenihabitans psoromatis TaxID=2528642 RepID=UPI001035EEE1|nr:substrate-binding domain-containing protein [Lichenihabitans psoromatis]
MTRARSRTQLTALAIAGLIPMTSAARADDGVAAAKAAIEKYAGPQTTWQGPTSAPKPAKDMTLVYLSGDEQNDISREYGLSMKEAAAKLGWKLTVIDGKGSPSSWVSGFNQAIALKPNGIAIFADAKSLQDPIRTAADKGITVIGLHAASLPGPAPDLHLFVNIQEDPREIGKAEADWAIADSNGTAKVVVITHNEYQIAETKSGATKDAILACAGCKLLDYANFPASEAAQRMPQLTTSWVQRFGLPIYITSVGDNDLDFAIPALRSAGVSPDQAKLIGADGNRSAYERIRKGKQYQTVTVSEPIELQAYQAVDEFNRAFNKAPPSGFVQPPYLVTAENVGTQGGDKNMFVPENNYKAEYLKIWGIAP